MKRFIGALFISVILVGCGGNESNRAGNSNS